MKWVKGFALVTCLAMPISALLATSASADSAAPAPAGEMTKKPSMTDDQKRAKSADCTKQADAKKLHGEERRKFRLACKKM